MLQQVVFWLFATILIISSFIVISSSFPVRNILALVVAFVAAAFLWIMQGAEFLGLGLIFVYVGAVMTLFLFVIMMLHQPDNKLEKKHFSLLILAVLFVISLVYLINYISLPKVNSITSSVDDLDNTFEIGKVLYKNYIFEFELAAYILLVGMIAAIALTFRGKRQGNKAVAVEKQINVAAKDRIHFAKFEQDK